MSTTSNAVIQVRQLTKDYGGGRGVFDVSFEVRRGEVLGFLGSNGAGKTVTMRHLMGFIRPQAGSAQIFGLDCFKQRAQIQGRLGYLPGEIAMDEQLTGRQFLRFAAKMRGLSSTQRMEELIERFELDPSARIGRMSKGTKQKVGLVAAFMARPDVLLLDEPTSGLDPLMQNRFIELVLEERDRGATVFLSSHIFEEVERCCSRVAFIREGHLAAIEDVTSAKASRKQAFELAFSSEEEAQRYLREHPGSAEAAGSCRVQAQVPGSADAFVKDLAGYSLESLASREQSLEETFMHFYGDGGAPGAGTAASADSSGA
ncbi:MAG: ABC transporter ATP-binding protein [Coriobacteriales bacterium]